MAGSRSAVVAALSSDFMDEFLVDCPACGGAALIRPTAPPADPAHPAWDLESRARRMVCTACGKSRDQAAMPLGAVHRPTMGLPLRLVASTRHGDLVAFNARHLDYLEQYLAGRLRQELPDPRGWAVNRSVVSRLPAWVKAAANREEVLAAIGKARKRLPASGG